jgi:dTDP-4-dehydrorhamnose reductase
MARACMHRNISFVLTGRDEIDLGDPRTMDAALKRHRPWAVVNAAGWVRVDLAEHAEQACRLVNASGAQALAAACADHGVPTLSFSSDLVFDGTKGACYVEADAPLPLNAYGRSKADMEAGLLLLPGRHLIIRTAAFFSPYDRHNFAVAVVDALRRGEQFRAADDLFVSPTYVPHLVATALDLLIDEEVGLWHLTNGEPISWASFARRVAVSLHLEPALVVEAPSSTFDWVAPRPVNGALSSSRGAHLPPLTAALEQFSAHMRAA